MPAPSAAPIRFPPLGNFAARFAGEGGVRVLSAIGFAVFARVMGPAGMGAYVTSLAFASFFVVLHDAGLHLTLMREIARAPGRAGTLIRQAGVLKGLIAFAAIAATPLTARLVGMPAEAAWLALCAALALNAGSFIEALGAALVGLERLDREAVLRITHRSATVLLPLGGWLLTRSVAGVLVAQMIGSLLVLAPGWSWLNRGRGGSAKDAMAPRGWSRHAVHWLSASWPITLSGLCLALSMRMDVVMLTRWWPAEVAGWYGAAQRFLELGMAVPAALGTVLLPSLTRLADHADRRRRHLAYAGLLRVFILAAIPATALLAGCSGILVRVLCGPDFRPSTPLLAGLAPALGLAFINYLFTYVLVAAGRQRTLLIVTMIAAGVNVTTNAVLVPIHGAAGAVAGRILTEAVMTTGCFAAFLGLANGPGWGFLLRLVPPAAVLAGLTVMLPGSAPAAIAGVAAFLALSWWTGAIGAPERAWLRAWRSG